MATEQLLKNGIFELHTQHIAPYFSHISNLVPFYPIADLSLFHKTMYFLIYHSSLQTSNLRGTAKSKSGYF